MSWNEDDRWFTDYQRLADDYADWREDSERDRADLLAERGGEHKPMKSELGSAPPAERVTPLVKGKAA